MPQIQTGAKIFPNWEMIEKFHNKLWDGEHKIVSYLDSHLSDDWEIYVQPFLNGSRPDVVILNPKIGIMIIEVKEWELEKYFFENEKLYRAFGTLNTPSIDFRKFFIFR